MRELPDDRHPARRLVSARPACRGFLGETVGLLVLLVANDDPAAEVGPGVVEQLAGLGVTDLSVLRDEETTAFSLAGWAFDSTRSAEAAARVVAAEGGTVRVLRPVLESAIHRLPNGRTIGNGETA
jgi:hypothetical protein